MTDKEFTPISNRLAFLGKDYETLEEDLATALEGAGYLINHKIIEAQTIGCSVVWIGAEACLVYSSMEQGRAYVQLISRNKEKYKAFKWRMYLIFGDLSKLEKLEKS